MGDKTRGQKDGAKTSAQEWILEVEKSKGKASTLYEIAAKKPPPPGPQVPGDRCTISLQSNVLTIKVTAPDIAGTPRKWGVQSATLLPAAPGWYHGHVKAGALNSHNCFVEWDGTSLRCVLVKRERSEAARQEVGSWTAG